METLGFTKRSMYKTERLKTKKKNRFNSIRVLIIIIEFRVSWWDGRKKRNKETTDISYTTNYGDILLYTYAHKLQFIASVLYEL